MRLIVDQADALAIAMLAQRCRELEPRVTGADDQDCSLRHSVRPARCEALGCRANAACRSAATSFGCSPCHFPPVIFAHLRLIVLILRSSVFAASRRMRIHCGPMVRDGARAPPHHEGECPAFCRLPRGLSPLPFCYLNAGPPLDSRPFHMPTPD